MVRWVAALLPGGPLIVAAPLSVDRQVTSTIALLVAACMALAIYFRKWPEYHRRLVFMASCQLMQAAFVRFPYIGYRDLSFPALDVLIVAGMLRDLVVDGRVNRVYLYILPPMIVLQSWATYLARVNPSWWQAATHAILGW